MLLRDISVSDDFRADGGRTFPAGHTASDEDGLQRSGTVRRCSLQTLTAAAAGFFGVLYLAPVDIVLGMAPFVLFNAVVFLLAAVTLSWQTGTLARIDPAEVLLG